MGSRALSPAAKPIIATTLSNARSDAKSLKLLSEVLINSTPRTWKNNFHVAQPGSTCEPLRPDAAVRH